MTVSRKLAAGAVVLALAITAHPAAAAARPAGRALDPAALQAALAAVPAAGAPGIVAQVRAGHEVWRGAAGVADLDTGRPMRPHLRHRAGSVTKTFVAATVLQLVGERRLGLDDPVARWLPGVLPAALAGQVTVRMLLNHTSGVPDYDTVIYTSYDDLEAGRFRHYTPRQLIDIAFTLPVGTPGVFSYANTNYVLAGLLIERVTGHRAEAEVTRRIIRPLGLRDTYFPGRGTTVRGPHAKAYLPWPEPPGVRDFSRYEYSSFWMAAGLVSTMADLNRFFRALQGGGVLRPAQLAAMRTGSASDPSYGLGLLRVVTPCGEVFGHDGVLFGQTTIVLSTPDGRRQVSIGMNVSHYAPAPPDLSPIDLALGGFLVLAACGSVPAAGSSADPTIPRTPSPGRFTPANQPT